MAGILLNLLAATAGGQVTRAEAFLRRFRRFNPDTRLLILKDSGSLKFCENVTDWDVKNVSFGRGRLRALRRLVWENGFIPQLMQKEHLDVYLTFSHYLPTFIGTNVRSIVGVSNLAPFSEEAWSVESNVVRLKMWLLQRSIVLSAKRANQVIALSDTCRDVLVDRGVNVSKITVIPNGVEINYQGDGQKTPSYFSSDEPYILSVSHFHRYKNYIRLVKAYGLLPEYLQQKYSLLIVGKPYDAKYFDEIKDLIHFSGLESRIHIIPGLGRTELESLYRDTSLFVFPSLIENSPNILLEAMAFGLPVLASNVDPMPEFGGNAISYFNGLSSNDLALRMVDLLSEESRVMELRVRAKVRSENYSWDAFTKNVVALCRA
jgi:glycosyltransferase involved in cell wall biosynthesis